MLRVKGIESGGVLNLRGYVTPGARKDPVILTPPPILSFP